VPITVVATSKPSLSDTVPLVASAALPGGDDEFAAGGGRTTSRDPDSPTVAVVSATTPSRDAWDCGLAFLWACGTALLLARMVGARWRLQRFRLRQAHCDDAGLRPRVEHLAARLGLRRRIDILVAPQLAAPIAFGVVRPVIVLPTGFLDDFDSRQQDAMLTHELAHLAAGDPVWQLLADLAAVLLWWHPLVWWARRKWRAAGELAADEASLLVPQGADTLAACLVALARRLESHPRLAWLAMAGPSWRSALGRRVEHLLDVSASTWRPPRRGRMGLVTATIPVALLLVAVSCTAWARTWAPVAQGATTMKVFVDCWRQSLAAVALATVLGPASGDTSRTIAAEGEHDVPRIKVEREGGDRPTAKPEREGERREARKEHAERKPDAREERKPEARGDREGGELAQRRTHLQEQAAEIRRKLQALKPHQDADERELKGALERIEAQLRELHAQAPNRERIQARVEELKAAHRRAQEAGRADEAERLAREARELMQTLEHRSGDRPAARPEGEEAQRRLQHLRVAIENLRAAGLNDQANALARDAERLARGERPASAESGRRPDGPRDVPAAAPHLERAVQELRGQVQEMRQQMEEMRQHLKALAEKR
jgi:beta-lactamase regulating signal transducer with metallopeptidase domain